MKTAGEVRVYYVSPEGNDAWSGRLDAPNSAGTDGPLRTLEGARDALRRDKPPERADAPFAWFYDPNRVNYRVLIRGGHYPVTRTVRFDTGDSAPQCRSISYEAYPGETPVFSAGVDVAEWQVSGDVRIAPEARGSVFEAPLPSGAERFHSLFDARGMLRRARGPMFIPSADGTLERAGDPLPKTGRAYIDDMPPEEKPLWLFRFPKGAMRNWDNLCDIEIYAHNAGWAMNYLPIAHVDEENQYAYTGIPSSYALLPRARKPSIAVENAVEHIAAPGEWAVDTIRQKIYLWPRGDKPEGIKYPCLRQLVLVEGENDFDGDNDVPVNGLRFRGLTFMHADRALWNLTDAGIQHDYELYDKDSALVRFRGTLRCGVEDCTFLHSGGSAVRFDLYAKECFAIGNEIGHMGQCGVTLIGHGPGTKDVNGFNAVVNNHIYEAAALYTQSPGIVLCQSGNNRIAHNELHDMPRKAILLSGTRLHMYLERYRRNQREVVRAIRWQEIQDPLRCWEDAERYAHTRDNIIEYNEVYRCLRAFSDGAAINVSGAGRGNQLRRNYVHDITCDRGHLVMGAFRVDDDQRGTHIYENVICRVTCPGVEFKAENYFYNNIIIGADPQYAVCAWREWGPMNRGRLSHNIIIDVFGDTFFYYHPNFLLDTVAADIDCNIYYRVPEAERETRECADMQATNWVDTAISPGDDLKTLQRMGHDTRSIAADPRLADWRHGDFRLLPDSPAHALGIASIDVSLCGRIKVRRTQEENGCGTF